MLYSTNCKPGQFQFEEYEGNIRNGKGTMLIQWDYRDIKGELHSGVAKTLDEAKLKASQFGYQA